MAFVGLGKPDTKQKQSHECHRVMGEEDHPNQEKQVTALRDWLIAQCVKTADGTGLARAIDYSLKRWPALMRYVDDGALAIDNNPAENAIRPIT
ncbi:MAG: family transposase [Proteobacteria bacterium]|nr:family transposase [Pseudomonadota bacterium]